jgi:hypothetical protein
MVCEDGGNAFKTSETAILFPAKVFRGAREYPCRRPGLYPGRAVVLRQNHPTACDLCLITATKILTKTTSTDATFSNVSLGLAPVIAISHVLMLLAGELMRDAR